MKNKYVGVALTVLLVVLAFFLPEKLSQWNDRTLLNAIHITEEDEAAGFAASIRLSVPEKLRLIRSRQVTPVELPKEDDKIRLVSDTDGKIQLSGTENLEAAARREAEAQAALWKERLEDVKGELSALRKVGAMPRLWEEKSVLTVDNCREYLYIDTETQVTFPVYYMELNCAPYTLLLTVDGQTGKFLSFTLRWTRGGEPRWENGTMNFGGAWRDYWDMDAVEENYLSGTYLRELLQGPPNAIPGGGTYSATTEVGFDYGGQSLRIPLHCRSQGDRCAILWNA